MGKVRTQYGYWHRRRRSIGCELEGYWIVELDGDPGHGQTRIFPLPAREQMKTLEVGHLCLFMCMLAGCLFSYGCQMFCIRFGGNLLWPEKVICLLILVDK